MSLCKFLWTTCFGHSYDHHQVRKEIAMHGDFFSSYGPDD